MEIATATIAATSVTAATAATAAILTMYFHGVVSPGTAGPTKRTCARESVALDGGAEAPD